MTAIAACTWTAVSNDSFLTVTSGSSGAGVGTVAFIVAASSASRTGTLTIAGQTVTVTQGTQTQELTTTQRQALVSRYVSDTLDGATQALNAAGVVGTFSAPGGATLRPLVRLINAFYKDVVECPGGGTITRSYQMTGATETSDGSDHVEFNGTQTYSNCVVYNDGLNFIVENGTFPFTMAVGKTPTGQQVLRVSGASNWRLAPANATGTCAADFEVNLFNLRDWRARALNANGAFCNVRLTNPLPIVVAFPPGVPVADPGSIAAAAGRWAGRFSTEPVGRCPAGSGSWLATVTVTGGAMTLDWSDSYHQQNTRITVTPDNTRTIKFTVGSGDDLISLTGTFSANWQSIEGPLTGPVCTGTSGRPNGNWSGNRQ